MKYNIKKVDDLMKRKLLAIFTSLMIVVGLFGAMPMTASAADVTAYYNGSGIFSDEGCTGSPITDTSAITSVIIWVIPILYTK